MIRSNLKEVLVQYTVFGHYYYYLKKKKKFGMPLMKTLEKRKLKKFKHNLKVTVLKSY